MTNVLTVVYFYKRNNDLRHVIEQYIHAAKHYFFSGTGYTRMIKTDLWF